MTTVSVNNQTIQSNSDYTKLFQAFAAGDTLEAEVLGEEDGRLNLKTDDGFVFSADRSEIKGEVSDKLSFEVIASEAGKLSLKQILPAEQEETPAAEAPTEEKLADALKKISVKVTEESKNAARTLLENNMEVQKESIKAIIRIKKTISYVASNITEEAITELEKSGFSKEKLTLDVLQSVLKETSAKHNKLSNKELSELVDKHVKKEKISSEELTAKAEIIKKLYETELPVTEKNIALVETAVGRYKDLLNLDEPAIASLIESGKELTVENVYIAQHSSKPKSKPNQEKMPEELWHRLLPEVKKTFTREQIENTPENTSAAKFLIENELPVTKENIEKYELLKDVHKQIPKEEVISKAAENIKKERPAADIPLTAQAAAITDKPVVTPEQAAVIQKENEQMIDDLPLIIADDEVIKITIAERGGKTIESFRKTYKNKKEQSREYRREIERLDRQEKSEKKPALDEREREVVRVKRQLAEIQFKLTKEASARLAGKGIEIDTLPLEQALDELKTVEKELYAKELIKADLPATEENTERIAEVFDNLRLLRPTSWRAYESIISEKADFTIKEVASANVRSREVLNDFETFATAPIAKFGDSLAKVLTEQVPELLTKLGIEPTEQNVRAAKILSRAQIDISAESMAEVKIVDQKLESITNRLHPAIAANMIKEGLNPLDMHVDEVSAYIDGYQDTYGDNLRDKISQYIMEMDDNKDLPPEERESMIAVYRLLNAVQKNESVAVGLALKSNAELTLGNLMEASKYYKRTAGRREDVDVRVDDQFGSLQKLVVKKESIRQILNENESAAAEEITESLKTAEVEITKENIRAAVRLSEKNLPVTEEAIKEEKVLMEEEKQQSPRSSSNKPEIQPRPEINSERRSIETDERPAEIQPRAIELNPFRPIAPEAAQVPADTEVQAELLNAAAEALKNLGIHPTDAAQITPAEALASAEKLLAATASIINKENITKAVTAQTLVRRIVSEITPQALTAMLQNEDRVSDKTAADILQKTDEHKSIRRSTTRTSFQQNAYSQAERPLKRSEQRELEKASSLISEIKKHEGELISAALKADVNLSAKTLPEIAQLIPKGSVPTRPAVSETLAAEYEQVLNELDENTKIKAETLLKDNNLGKTPDNLRVAAVIVEQAEVYEDLNQEAIKQIIQNNRILDEFTEAAIPEKLHKLIKEQLEAPKAAPLETVLTEIKNEQDIKHQSFEKVQTEKYVDKLRQINEISPAAIRWMEKNHVPLTMVNMQAMQSLVKNPFGLGKSLNNLKEKEEERGISEEAEESLLVEDVLESIPDSMLADLSSGEGSPEDFLDELYRKLENISGASDSREIIEQVKSIQSSLMIQKKSSSMKLPIRINGNISDLNVYVINDISNKNEIKAFLSLKTERLGTVQIHLNMQDGKVDLALNSDKTEASEFLSQNAGILQELMKEVGCEVGALRYDTEEERNLLSEETAGDIGLNSFTGGSVFEVRA